MDSISPHRDTCICTYIRMCRVGIAGLNVWPSFSYQSADEGVLHNARWLLHHIIE